jgi:hypothetical protein
MKTMFKTFVAIAVLSSATGAAASDAQRNERILARAVDGRVAGAPVACVTFDQPYSIEVIDKTAVVYRLRDGTMYVNRPLANAENLNRDTSSWRENPSKRPLCVNDVTGEYGGEIYANFRPSFRPMVVTMGPFVPYKAR